MDAEVGKYIKDNETISKNKRIITKAPGRQVLMLEIRTTK